MARVMLWRERAESLRRGGLGTIKPGTRSSDMTKRLILAALLALAAVPTLAADTSLDRNAAAAPTAGAQVAHAARKTVAQSCTCAHGS